MDAVPHEFVGALIDVGSRNLEGQLKRSDASLPYRARR
jgi:hypothetical protein